MPTFTRQILSGADDAVENAATGATVLDDITLNARLGYYVGLRFLNVEIPQGANITSCRLALRFSTASETLDLGVDFEASDNAAPFQAGASNHNLSSRSFTGHSIIWQGVSGAADFVLSPDLSAPLQAVINRPNWNSGGAVAVVMGGGSNANCRFRSYDYNPDLAAWLYVEYELEDLETKGFDESVSLIEAFEIETPTLTDFAFLAESYQVFKVLGLPSYPGAVGVYGSLSGLSTGASVPTGAGAATLSGFSAETLASLGALVESAPSLALPGGSEAFARGSARLETLPGCALVSGEPGQISATARASALPGHLQAAGQAPHLSAACRIETLPASSLPGQPPASAVGEARIGALPGAGQSCGTGSDLASAENLALACVPGAAFAGCSLSLLSAGAQVETPAGASFASGPQVETGSATAFETYAGAVWAGQAPVTLAGCALIQAQPGQVQAASAEAETGAFTQVQTLPGLAQLFGTAVGLGMESAVEALSGWAWMPGGTARTRFQTASPITQIEFSLAGREMEFSLSGRKIDFRFSARSIEFGS